MTSAPHPTKLPAATADAAGVRSSSALHTAAITCPPTVVDPAAIDLVSVLTAAQFGAYAANFLEVSDRFAAACAQLVKSLAMNTGSDPTDGHSTQPAAT
ncbi:PE family protein [Mycobacterium sp.]|uniref:PE family protein n=1 Tax=Mycobacterium sp. TaxID=1785 RepID=UPI002CF978EB|nr:PE family protein [Mycobacterium sp.]HTQ21479.1 PE family protein [Mycobacterium sp.]